MDQAFIFLYPLVAVLSCTAFLPQIVMLLRAETSQDQISLSSWAVWLVSCLISFGYGLYHLRDPMFCLTTGLSLSMIVCIIALVLYNRHIRFTGALQRAPAQKRLPLSLRRQG